MFFIGGALGTALATVVGFMTLMSLDENVGSASLPTTTTVAREGISVTLLESAETTVVFVGTEFAYEPVSVAAEGDFELVFENAGRVIHNLEIEGVSGLVLEANPGNSASELIRLDPGTYTIFCSIPGHRAAGMEGTLDVRE